MTGPGPSFSILVRPGHPDFLDLPWRRPLTEWRSGRLVEVERGIHRHVVRFVDYGGRLKGNLTSGVKVKAGPSPSPVGLDAERRLWYGAGRYDHA